MTIPTFGTDLIPSQPVFPTLPSVGLTEAERELVNVLSKTLAQTKQHLGLRDAYYDGMQVVTNLGIAVPPELSKLRTVIGWPALGVDSLEERLDVEGFRYPDALDSDQELWDWWQDNNMDEESQLGFLDSLIHGWSFIAVGSSDEMDSPLITVESAYNLAALWDPQRRHITSALRLYSNDDGSQSATLYVPNETVALEMDREGHWQVTARDVHNLGRVLIVRVANRQRVTDRVGRSEITPAVMSITDSACRTLLGIEVAREFYSAPQRWVLGATEEAFVKADGSTASAWETYLGRILALERDEEGNLPEVGQFQPYDPSAFTKVIDMYADVMAGIFGLPPHYLGKTTANPASADAIRSAEQRLIKRAERRQRAFGGAVEEAMRLALMVRNNGVIPDGARRLETQWKSAATPTPGATTDAAVKQVSEGIVPATSDVLLSRLGYSAVERRRIALERKQFAGNQFLTELASGIQTPGTQQTQPGNGAVQ